jgi:endonuclease-3
MAALNRTALIGKLHKVLKKHYKPAPPTVDRPLMEQLLFACCLENAPYEPAEEAFARLTTTFFDWNEIRVTTVKELAEVMHMLPAPTEAATRLKKTLQGVFETNYSFELEGLKKQNIGQAITKLEKMSGRSHFIVGYVTQATLGGHAIPLDHGALWVLSIVGLATPAEQKSGTVAGLERAIPKNKGVEFASLLHQLGADLVASPFSQNLHKTLLEIAPDAKERLPKRQAKKAPEPPPKPAKKGKDSQPAAKAKEPAGKGAVAKKGSDAKPATKKAVLPTAKKKPSKAVAKPKPR